MNANSRYHTMPATSSQVPVDPPLPYIDPLPLTAQFVTMRRPNGAIVRILDVEDYVVFMEHIGYVRVASESGVTP